MSSLLQRPSTLDDLEDALLELIFAYACASPWVHGRAVYRHNPAIPAVCRRFARVYSQSALLWEEVRVNWAALAQQAITADARAAFAAGAAWLSARLPFAQRLVLRGCFALASLTEAPPLVQLFPGGLCSPRLIEARLEDAWGGYGAELLCTLRSCPALRSVSLACQPRARGREAALVVQAQLLPRLACLPSLASLDLHVDRIAGSLAELPAALPGLTRLCLRCRMESAALAPELLERLCQLRRLELENVRVAQFTPRLAQALSQLTHLSCADVLAAQPRRRAGVQLWQGLRHLASLQSLRLERQAGAGMPANALACRGLRGLTLVACEAGDWPTAPHLLAGKNGCLGSLAALHLESLHLAAPVPAQLWRHLGDGLTSLTWRSVLHSVPQLLLPEEGLHMHMRPLEVPAELAHLRALRTLRLEYCGLEAPPPAVQALTRLTSLSLEGNRISALPAWRSLAGLHCLSLANNVLPVGPPEGLAACSSLCELSFQGDCLSLGAEGAAQLARLLPQQCRLLVSLAPMKGPSLEAGLGPTGAAGEPPLQAEEGAPLAGQAGPGSAAQQAQHAGAAALEAHLVALQRLRRALGQRLVVEEPAFLRF